MPSRPQDLAALLGQVRRPGDFYATGTLDIHPPRLEVEGIAPIALPLLPVQAEQIIALAERAPYVRGTETVVGPGAMATLAADCGSRPRGTGGHVPFLGGGW